MMSYRRVGRSIASRGNKFWNKLWNSAAGGAGAAAFALQATSSDRSYANAHGLLNGFTGTQKAEQWLNWIISRVTFGMASQPFGDVYAGNTPSFKIGNTLNKFTGAGILTWLYGKLGDGLPLRSKVGKFGIPLMLGGVLGGLFDDPAGQVSPGTTSNLSSSGGVLSGTITRGGGFASGLTSSNLNSR